MKRHWKQILLAGAGALASTIVAALTKREDKPTDSDTPKGAAVGVSSAASSAKDSAGLRAAAISFLSDVMAETYRKLRTDQGEKRR